MKLDEMELLIRVAETASMTLAAQQLHLTPAAVSAAVQRIENNLGLRLFERTTRSLHPTEEGLVIVEGCKDVMQRWQRTLKDARGQRAELDGSIRLAAPTDTTYQLLEPLVAELCRAHPKLRVLMDTSDMVQHLQRDAIDLAIRYGPLQDSSLMARKLTESPGVLVASPAYLEQHGRPERPEDLAEHRCLTLQLGNTPQRSWQLSGPAGELYSVDVDSALCGDGHLARRWALAGQGIALKALFDVIDDLDEGALMRVLPEHQSPPYAIHAVFPSRRFQTARVQALLAAIATRFTARALRCQHWLVAGVAFAD